ncbi:membrane protein YczE [Solirubrobacter soli]|uniref:membrane protein YczE n=1 Tax=Solirubrobacter soli TaxID=363832 RepID=UPI000427C743|nr:membrane protein [Solirubrobacter soli]
MERAARLLAGLVLFGLALAVLVQADLGLDPWTVFHQGISKHVDLSLGTITVISSLTVLALWIPLGERPGLGTIANALIVGPVLDLGVATIPAPHALALRYAYVLGGILAIAVATGLYVDAGWGPGPRDGLMTGMAKRGVPVALARAAIELTVLIAGFLLGGTVGVATVLFALLIGPLVKPALSRFAIRSQASL